MRLIDSEDALREVAHELAGCATLYLDTEFESSRAGQRLSLIQVSDGERTFVVDALRLESLEPLARVMADVEREWVLHAGTQDVDLLRANLKIELPRRIFDTQVGWALVGPEYSVSLAYLVYRVLGIRTGKPHQADDWLRRPLPASQLDYAAQDVEHLPRLKQDIERRAAALGRLDLVHDVCRDQLVPEREVGPPERLRLDSFRNAWQLDAQCQAGLHSLIDWYNELGEAERRRAPDSKALFSIASRLPKNRAELGRLKGVPRGFVDRYGDELTARLRAAAEVANDSPNRIEPSPYATFERICLDGWLQAARASVCAELSVAPELALPNRLLSRVGDELGSGGTLEAALGRLSGWRQRLLDEPFRRYSARHGLPPDAADGLS
jgi:ribonuclease D